MLSRPAFSLPVFRFLTLSPPPVCSHLASRHPAKPMPRQLCRSWFHAKLLSRRAELKFLPRVENFRFPPYSKPSGCPASIGISVPWLAVAEASRLELAVEPNRTPSTREAAALIAGRSFFIRQAAQPQLRSPRLPSRLVFAVNVKGESGTKRLTAWARRLQRISSRSTRTRRLLVTPKTNTDGRRAYEISIKPGAALPHGTSRRAPYSYSRAGSPNRSACHSCRGGGRGPLPLIYSAGTSGWDRSRNIGFTVDVRLL